MRQYVEESEHVVSVKSGVRPRVVANESSAILSLPRVRSSHQPAASMSPEEVLYKYRMRSSLTRWHPIKRSSEVLGYCD
jgi:hypothetical protein